MAVENAFMLVPDRPLLTTAFHAASVRLLVLRDLAEPPPPELPWQLAHFDPNVPVRLLPSDDPELPLEEEPQPVTSAAVIAEARAAVKMILFMTLPFAQNFGAKLGLFSPSLLFCANGGAI